MRQLPHLPHCGYGPAFFCHKADTVIEIMKICSHGLSLYQSNSIVICLKVTPISFHEKCEISPANMTSPDDEVIPSGIHFTCENTVNSRYNEL